jgi:class 3 adenylate cyclase/tetratricopeptide (TPR) repeat protein
VLFADLAGSTSVAEQLDPEDWAEIASVALTAMSESVARFGGSVTRLMGDGLLALFGAPVASENDPERAIRAGLEMVQQGDDLRDRARRFGARPESGQLDVRVGIATGEVLAGQVGSATTSEYTVLGDAANLAARLEKLAPPGTVLVATATKAAAESIATFRHVGSLDVRGKEGAVDGYVVVGLSDDSVGGSGHSVPVIGRAEERRRLEQAVDAARAGRGVVAGILADAGLGKSRLLQDLVESASSRKGTSVVRATAVSYESATGLAFVRRVVAGMGGEDRIAVLLVGLPDERRTMLLAAIDALSDVTAETTVDTVSDALAETLAAMMVGTDQVLILAADDLHWADAASVEVLTSLLELTDRHPLCLLWASRPTRSGPVWGLKQTAEAEYPHRYVEVGLAPFTSEDAATFVRSLLGADADDSLVGTIAERAGGNPYFVEEIVRELTQVGSPEDRERRLQGIPPSLQRLLRARFDRLSAATRDVLEVVAVAGSTFDPSLPEAVLGVDAGRAVHELLREGIVEQETGTGFRFRHSLTREAAYDSITRRRRRDLHLRVGEVLAARDATVDPAVLAFHFREAGDPQRAARYGLDAGTQAVRVGAYVDACRHFDEALAGLSDDDPLVPRLLVGRGKSRDVIGDIDGATSDLDRALDAARRSQDPELGWEVLVALGESWAARDYRKTGEHYRAALDIARRLDTPDRLGTSLNRLGNWYANAENPRVGIAMHTEALELFRSVGSAEGEAATLDLLGMANLIGGDLGDARRHFLAAITAFEALGDRRGKVGPLIASVIGSPNYETLSDPPFVETAVALAALDEASDLARAFGWSAAESFSLFMRSQLLACSGRLGEGLAAGEEALAIARAIGHAQWELASLICVGAAVADTLDFEPAAAHLDEAEHVAAGLGSVNWELQVASISAAIAIRAGDLDRAESTLLTVLNDPAAEPFLSMRGGRVVHAWLLAERGLVDESLSILGATSNHAPFVALVRSRALRGRDPDSAVAVLAEGIDAAKRWGMTPLAWQLHLEHASLTGSVEHRTRAESLFAACVRSLDDDEAAARMRAEGLRRYGLMA